MPPTLQEVDAYTVPTLLIPRIAKEHNFSLAYASRALREAKRMLFLSVISQSSVSPSKIVDYAWHEMLMFTRFYQEFCAFIGDYIHHDPTPGVPDGGILYTKTKQQYKQYFGEQPDPYYWP